MGDALDGAEKTVVADLEKGLAAFQG